MASPLIRVDDSSLRVRDVIGNNNEVYLAKIALHFDSLNPEFRQTLEEGLTRIMHEKLIHESQADQPPLAVEGADVLALHEPLQELASALLEEEVNRMITMFCMTCQVPTKPACAQDLFASMIHHRKLRLQDITYLQSLLWKAGRSDLFKSLAERARELQEIHEDDDPPLRISHLDAPSLVPIEGYKYVKFHLKVDLLDIGSEQLQKLEGELARLLGVPRKCIAVMGVEPDQSAWVTVILPTVACKVLEIQFDLGTVQNFLLSLDIDKVAFFPDPGKGEEFLHLRQLQNKPGMTDDISQQDIEKIKQSIAMAGVPKAMEFISSSLQKWKSVPLRVALVGESGVGKSSFINCVRGLTADDEGAAAIGIEDSTHEPTPYPHPDNDNIVFWDLPGVGTVKFPREEYLSRFCLNAYDFFIIVGEIFTTNDAWLAREIRREGKDIFCVRMKIDETLRRAKRDQGQNYNEDQVIQDIKKKCAENLLVDPTKVYVVDNYDKEGWDFPCLLEDILASLPEQQRLALLLTLGPLTKHIIQMKADALRQRVWKVATLAAVATGAVSAIPVAGAVGGAVLDMPFLVEEINFYRKEFGLDRDSLEHTACRLGIPLEELSGILQTVSPTMTPEVLKDLIRKIIAESTVAAVTQSAKAFVAFVVPILGGVSAGAFSFGMAVYILRSAIEKLQEDAERVADKLIKVRKA